MPPSWFSCVVMLGLRSPALLLASIYTAYYTDRQRLLTWTGIIPDAAKASKLSSHIDIVTVCEPGVVLFLTLLFASDRCVRRVYLAILLAVVLPSICGHVSSHVFARVPHGFATDGCRPTATLTNITWCDIIDALQRQPRTGSLGGEQFWRNAFERSCCQCLIFTDVSACVSCGTAVEINVENAEAPTILGVVTGLSAVIFLQLFSCKQRLNALLTLLLFVSPVIAVLVRQTDPILDDGTSQTSHKFSLAISYMLVFVYIMHHLKDNIGLPDVEDDVIELQLYDKYERTVTATVVSWAVAVPILVADEILRSSGMMMAVDWQLAARVATGSAVMHCGASAMVSRASGFVFSRLTGSISRCLPGVRLEHPMYTGFKFQLLMLVCCFVLGADRFVLAALYTALLCMACGVSKAVRPLLEKPASSFDRKSLVTLRCVLLAVGLFPPFAFHVMFSVLVNYNDDGCAMSSRSLYPLGLLTFLSLSYEALFAMIRLAVGLPKGPRQPRSVFLAKASTVVRRCCLVFEVWEELGQLVICCLFVVKLYTFNVERCGDASTCLTFKVVVYLIIVCAGYVTVRQALRLKPLPIHCVAALPTPSVDDPRLADLCAVCMDTMTSEKARKTRCGHVFHRQCLEMCIDVEPSCPMCRGKMF